MGSLKSRTASERGEGLGEAEMEEEGMPLAGAPPLGARPMPTELVERLIPPLALLLLALLLVPVSPEGLPQPAASPTPARVRLM